MSERMIPGAKWALRIIHPGSPLVKERYPRGILVDPHGFPRWVPYARATVHMPEPRSDLTFEENRIVDVLVANELMTKRGDPLWEFTTRHYVNKTPPGWTWAHVGMTRDLMLVPAELHSSYRHLGGVSTMPVDRSRRGVRGDDDPRLTGVEAIQLVPGDIMDTLDVYLGFRLPTVFRSYFARTNGGAPKHVGVWPPHGFVVDQPLFGLGRDDRHQDIIGANNWFGDRLNNDFLAIGYVQGGLLLLKVRGEDLDSIWYWDDDDYRDDDAFDADHICGNLIHRCADDIEQFWGQLLNPAKPLLNLVTELVTSGVAVELRPEGAGGGLPDDRRASWQPAEPAGDHPLLDLADVDRAARIARGEASN
jgi:hypothetical protein